MEQNRNTVLAIMEETTEGTLVAPAAGTDFIANQDSVSFEPGTDVLESKELRASIGKAKAIHGAEKPSGSIDHYFRHSGVEGQAPGFRKLLKAAVGSENVNGTERQTTSSSTTSLIKAASGGSDFARGRAVLVKDTANGSSIRALSAVATNDLTPAFKLPAAPASGVKLGKCVSYEPVNTGHPTLSIWRYLANRAAVEAIAGCRVNSLGLDFPAGDLISAAFKIEGLGYFFDPIEITSSTRFLDLLDDAATRAVSVPAKWYKDPIDLAQALQDALNAAGSANTFTVVYDSTTGRFTITSTGTTLTLKWNTGANTANSIASKIGFSTAADSSGALTYTGSALSFVAGYTPSYDAADPLAAKDNELLLGDATDNVSLRASKFSGSIDLDVQTIKDISSATGLGGKVVAGRSVKFSIVTVLNQYDAAKFKKYRAGDTVQLQYSFGVKSGGNWVPGKCGCVFLPTAVISGFKIDQDNGVLVLSLDVEAYVDSNGQGEVYLNFL
jgi:hypothetical protein